MSRQWITSTDPEWKEVCECGHRNGQHHYASDACVVADIINKFSCPCTKYKLDNFKWLELHAKV